MKVFRSIGTLLGVTATVALAVMSSGCEFARKVIAKDKLNQGAILYNQGRVAEAAAFFKDATDLIPDNPVAWLFYGSTLYKEFQQAGPEDRQRKGEETLNIYKKALDLAGDNCKTQDNAISYIAKINDDMGRSDEHRNWLLKRADGPCATKEIKATTYYSIGQGYWQCAYDQTTRYADKANKDPFHYRNFDYDAARPDKAKVEDCITRGLEYVEKALQVDPEYTDAMFYKGLLYREKQKMTKNEAERKKHEEEAKKINDQATALAKKKQEQQGQATPAPQG